MVEAWLLESKWVLATLGVFAGAGGMFFYQASRFRQAKALLEAQWQGELALVEQSLTEARQQLTVAEKELNSLDDERDKNAHELKQSHGRLMAAMEKLRHFDAIQQEKHKLQQEAHQWREKYSELNAEFLAAKASHHEAMQAQQEKLSLLEQTENRLKQEFAVLSQQILDTQAEKVEQQNKATLSQLINPLQTQLDGFKKQVHDVYNQEAKERHTLVHELKNLQRLNENMAKEALNLTQALKGDNKQQGNWGEVVLARVLSESGLREGHEYHTQVNLQNQAGKRYQPDVVVELPQQKQVVVDAKMSLNAYERYFHAESDSDRQEALSAHLLSIRNHIKGLSQKDYHQLKGITSLDYVLMFIPVEPAFQLAIKSDPQLVKQAMEHNIILVSPTTLLVALRTIDNLWRNDRQNQNAQRIAEKASKLYDKLRLFVDDMQGLGHALDKANQSYQGAFNKLATGKGNAIRQAEAFQQLGVEIKKPIDNEVRELALQGIEAQDEIQAIEKNLQQRQPDVDKVN